MQGKIAKLQNLNRKEIEEETKKINRGNYRGHTRGLNVKQVLKFSTPQPPNTAYSILLYLKTLADLYVLVCSLYNDPDHHHKIEKTIDNRGHDIEERKKFKTPKNQKKRSKLKAKGQQRRQFGGQNKRNKYRIAFLCDLFDM